VLAKVIGVFITQPASRTSVNLVADALQGRVKRSGAGPLITYYRDDARIELSAITFANWVDKSANLLTALDADDHPRLLLDLLRSATLHWTTLVWAFAGWQLGGTIVAPTSQDFAADLAADVAIVGPERAFPVPGVETIACTLHPLGLGFPQRPDGVTDAAELLAQPDLHWSTPPASSTQACHERLGEAAPPVAWAAFSELEPSDRRLLISAAQPEINPFAILQLLLRAVLGDGSLVIVDGSAAPERLTELSGQERAEIVTLNRD